MYFKIQATATENINQTQSELEIVRVSDGKTFRVGVAINLPYAEYVDHIYTNYLILQKESIKLYNEFASQHVEIKVFIKKDISLNLNHINVLSIEDLLCSNIDVGTIFVELHSSPTAQQENLIEEFLATIMTKLRNEIH